MEFFVAYWRTVLSTLLAQMMQLLPLREFDLVAAHELISCLDLLHFAS